MKRRAFFRLQPSLKAEPSSLIPFKTKTLAPTGLDPYTGPWGGAEVTHLLRRTMFGAKSEEVAYFLDRDRASSVYELLRPIVGDPPLPVNDYIDDGITDPNVAFGQTWINAPHDDAVEGSRIWSLKSWWIGNMIEQDRSILEKMILFWHNHIPIQFYPVFVARFDYDYLMKLRHSALTNFKDLVRDITLDRAMLLYLNGQFNSAGEPDENYSRELQELFCIGKGPNAKFTEGDVQAAARILTGWRFDWETYEVGFRPWAHDAEDKQFSSFYGDQLIKGRNGQEGAQELDELLNMIFDNDECALFVCRKIYRFFVHHEIDETTEEFVIEPLADIFRTNNYQITPVLEVLFNSEHFFDPVNRGALLKSPVDYNIGMIREFGSPIPDRSQLRDRYQYNGALVWLGELQQQSVGDPPNVSGWPAYYQTPVFDKAWITTDSLPRRAQVADWLLFSGIGTDNTQVPLDILGTVAKIPDAGDPNILIDMIASQQLSIEMNTALKTQLKVILLSGQISDYYWTDAWSAYINDPGNEMKRETVRSRLLAFFYTLLHQEEYQLS